MRVCHRPLVARASIIGARWQQAARRRRTSPWRATAPGGARRGATRNGGGCGGSWLDASRGKAAVHSRMIASCIASEACALAAAAAWDGARTAGDVSSARAEVRFACHERAFGDRRTRRSFAGDVRRRERTDVTPASSSRSASDATGTAGLPKPRWSIASHIAAASLAAVSLAAVSLAAMAAAAAHREPPLGEHEAPTPPRVPPRVLAWVLAWVPPWVLAWVGASWPLRAASRERLCARRATRSRARVSVAGMH